MSDSKFKEFYQKLNKKQKEAVDSIEGPVMVIAGPGTGKTTVLTLRVAQILRKTDTPASGILAITYTDSGVKSMRQKLRETIGGQADDVEIHTFHSFAVSVIRDYPDHFPHLSGAEPMTEIESREFIEEILKEKKFSEIRPFGRPDLYVEPILSAISQSKREAHTPEMLKDYAEGEIKRIQDDKKEYSNRGLSKGELKAEAKKKIQKLERAILLSEVYKKYDEKKIQKKKIDFDDMIFELERALKKDELLLRLLQEKYLYLLVDEHQDTNDSQNTLILFIADFFETPNVFIVGDEKQAIYRFQGASLENFLKFKREWRDVKLIQLDTSYRSHQKILDAGFQLIENNYKGEEHKDLRVELKAGKNEKEKPIVVAKGKNIVDTEEYLIHQVKNILSKELKAEIALIVRTNASVGRLKRLCENRGVKASSVRNVDIFEHPAGRLFFDLISAVFDPLNKEALGKTISAGLWGFSLQEQIEVLKELRADRLKDKSLQRKIKNLNDSIYSGDPLGFLFELADSSFYTEKISSEPERMEIWRGIIELSETILRSRDNSSDTKSLLQELLAFRGMSEQKQVKIFSGDPESRVQIMTAHGSKGLEFDYVFLPYATESFWLKKGRSSFFALPFEKTSSEDEIKDSRRLFYVALTRAKKHVEILTHTELEGGETDLSLRFIEELGENNFERKEVKEIGKISLLKVESRNEKLKKSYLDEAKRVLKEKGLSVTALNHFLECPNIFLYRSILKIPDLPNINSEKGNAMHFALAWVLRTKERDLKKIEKTVKKKAFEYLQNSFLNKFEIEALKDSLNEEIPIMVRGLKEHFAISGKTFVEKPAAGELEFSLKSHTEKIKVPIHGRLDLVVENKDSVEVFDYKTRKGMSPAEIKGETKNSDGRYFRQLVFYTLLLSQNPRYKDLDIIPYLIFLTPDQKGRVKTVSLPVSKEDLESLKDEIKELLESVYSGEILQKTCDNPKCEWCALRQVSGF